jgi:hypothetical protein
VTASLNAASAGGALVGTPGRPASPDRPRRFDDDARNNAYWARIIACADAAPPLSMEQRAVIRTAFSTVTAPRIEEAA